MERGEDEVGFRRVHLIGELDVASAEAARRALVEAVGSVVIAELDRLSFIDATGLDALLRAKAEIEATGHELRLEVAAPGVRRIFELSGLVGLLDR